MTGSFIKSKGCFKAFEMQQGCYAYFTEQHGCVQEWGKQTPQKSHCLVSNIMIRYVHCCSPSNDRERKKRHVAYQVSSVVVH
jgi:hypothetical protein